MSGYTIDQLLAWTLEDYLIDGYTICSNGDIAIYCSGRKHVLERQRAEAMLRTLIRRISQEPEGGDGDT